MIRFQFIEKDNRNEKKYFEKKILEWNYSNLDNIVFYKNNQCVFFYSRTNHQKIMF